MPSLRSILSSTPRVIVGVLVLVVIVVMAGWAAGVFGVPSVGGVENRFGGVNESVTVIETDLVVENPNPIGASLGGVTVNYTVSMNDIAMANGTKDGVRVASGNSTLNFTTTMRNGKIPAWWVTHVRNGERTDLAIRARVRSSLLGQSATVPHETEIPTDIISQFNSTETRPVNAGSPLVSDPVLYVNETGASWGEVTDARTDIDLRFVVFNPKATPYTVTEIGYEITMNDVGVGEGRTENPYVIEGRTDETIETTTTAIRNGALDEWWVSHIRRNQVTDLRIDFYARIELPTGNTVRVPLDALTYEKRIETDIFGTKDETPPGRPGEASPTPTRSPGGTGTPRTTPTPGPDTGTPTSTPTETPRLVPTPTPTPTPTGSTPTASPTPSPTDDDIIGL